MVQTIDLLNGPKQIVQFCEWPKKNSAKKKNHTLIKKKSEKIKTI